jgi:RNA-directed DNA polymerase
MRESDTEGVATHGGPESCVGVREGVGEAWTGVRVGRPLSREIKAIGVPTLLTGAEGNTAGSVIRELPVGPARSKNPGMHGISRRENREVPRSPVPADDAPPDDGSRGGRSAGAGREGNAEAVSP